LALKALCFLTILTLILTLFYLFDMIYINHLVGDFNILSFWGQSKAGFAAMLSTCVDLLSEKGTTLVLKLTSLSSIEYGIQLTGTLKTRLSNLFSQDILAETPQLKDIIYEDACEYISPEIFSLCLLARNGANSAGLIQLFSNFEDGLSELRSQYLQANNSSEVLNQLQKKAVNEGVLPIAFTIINVIGSLTNILDEEFEISQDKYLTRNELSLYLGLIFIMVMGVLLYKEGVNRLKERETDFRKILQTLPTGLVFSNFVLKSYLIQISNGAFDYIKNRF